MARSRWKRMNVGITHESLGELRELRFLVEKVLGDPTGVTANQVIAWAFHAALGMPEKQRIKFIVAGAQREAVILKAGNPGNPGTNGHNSSSEKSVIIGGGTQQIATPKQLPRRIDRSRGNGAQDGQQVAIVVADL